jgi:DNA-binding NarL/FixJ family response regulator
MVLVVIGERDAAYRWALARTIGSEPGLMVAGHTDSVSALVTLLVAEAPHVAVVDIRLPGDLVGLVARAKTLGVACRFIGMTTLLTPAARELSRRVGFDTLVTKGDGAEVLAAITAAG